MSLSSSLTPSWPLLAITDDVIGVAEPENPFERLNDIPSVVLLVIVSAVIVANPCRIVNPLPLYDTVDALTLAEPLFTHTEAWLCSRSEWSTVTEAVLV